MSSPGYYRSWEVYYIMFQHEKWRRPFRRQSIFNALPSLSHDTQAYLAFNASVLFDKAGLNPTIRYLGKLSASLGRKSTRRSIDLALCSFLLPRASLLSPFFARRSFVIGTCFMVDQPLSILVCFKSKSTFHNTNGDSALISARYFPLVSELPFQIRCRRLIGKFDTATVCSVLLAISYCQLVRRNKR